MRVLLDTKADFFLPMIPPTVTDQQHRIVAREGKRPLVFDSDELAAAKDMLKAHLARQMVSLRAGGYRTISGVPVRLVVMWCFPAGGKHMNGEYRITKPDTDNLNKALKDIMTKLGYWQDDALVASEICEKLWADVPGLFVKIQTVAYRFDDN